MFVVADGGRVDEQEEAVFVRLNRAVAAILRADIDGWRNRQPRAFEDVLELGGIIVREEDIVMQQRKALCFRNGCPRYRG